MANHKQAKKRNRQRIKRTARNRHLRSTLRTTVKKVRAFLEQKNKKEAEIALKTTISFLDKAVTKGILHRKTASRTISRLTGAFNNLEI